MNQDAIDNILPIAATVIIMIVILLMVLLSGA